MNKIRNLNGRTGSGSPSWHCLRPPWPQPRQHQHSSKRRSPTSSSLWETISALEHQRLQPRP